MPLKFGILFLALFTSQLKESLAHPQECDNVASIEVCLGNKNVEVQVSPNDLTCQASEVSTRKVRDDYTRTPGVGYHKFHSEVKLWNEARKICIEEGGHLAIINSEKEHQAIYDMYKREEMNIRNSAMKEAVWLGAHNMYDENEWVTIFGDTLSSTGYARWTPGEPNNPGKERCLGLWCKEKGDLLDGACHTALAFVCEIPDACT